MADDIVSSAKKQTDVAVGNGGSGASGKIVWLGNGKGSITSTYSGGVPITTPSKNYSTVEKMQNSIVSWGASRSPMYDTYVSKLVNGGFMSKSYADQPLYAAKALEDAVSMFQSYNGTGGTLGFDDWFDWYSSTGTGGKSGGGGAYTGPVTTTSTTVYSDKAAETVLQKMAREKFGYNLSKREVADYTKQLQEEQKKNPSVTRSAGTGGTRTSDTTQAVSGEVLAGEMLGAEQQAEDFAVESIGMEQMWNSINRGMKVIQGA